MPMEEGQQTGPYTSYDPREVKPESEVTPLRNEAGEALPGFDPRVADDLEGLLYLGALIKEFNWLGHTFVIRTLTQDEVLVVPMLMKKWQGTIGEAKAYTTAMVALSIVTVDNQQLPVPIAETSDEFAWAWQRFNYVKGHWFQYAIDKVYGEYLALEAKAQEVIEAMEKASGPTDSMAG